MALLGEDRRTLLRLMLDRAFRVGDFLLTSGRRSPYYFDGRLVTLDPVGALLVGRTLLEFAREDKVEMVGGPTLGADPMVTAVALCSALDGGPKVGAFIVRKGLK
ncbi:MAG: orotate phosphoribosyltransferase, partial [Candidatus Dormiibacterota bacterium]